MITSTLTFAATANAITYVGAEPVFVDSEPQTWTMDPHRLEEALSDLERRGTPAKAVITVDLYGQVCDYEAIEPICARRGIPIIEDAAEALGSVYKGKNAGTFGVMAALSFNGNKIITTAGGGMLLSQNPAHTDRARFLATQARDPAPHYQHSTIGYNYRLSNLLAAVGRGQLQVLDERVAARRAVREHYRSTLSELPGVRLLDDPPGTSTNAWLSVLLIDPKIRGVSREQIRLHLEQEQIESRPVWKPMHCQPVFERYRSYGGEVAQSLFRDGLCLPSGSSLTPNDLDRIVLAFRSAR